VILFFTFPILVLIFNAIFDSEAVSIRLIVLSIISLSGIAISIGTEIDTVDVRGVILALIAAVAMASSIILAQRQLSKNSILGLAFVSNFTASVLALLLWSLIGQSHFPNLPDETRILGITMMLAVGILFAAGLLLQLKGIRCIGSNSTSIALNFEPIVTLIIATVFIGEILTWNKIIGAILVVTAVVLSTLSDQPAPEPEP